MGIVASCGLMGGLQALDPDDSAIQSDVLHASDRSPETGTGDAGTELRK